MYSTLAAILAAFLTTGMSSYISHPLTVVGSCVVCLIMAGFAIVHPASRVHPVFLLGGLAMAVLALLSAEANRCDDSSTIHVISCYLAMLSMGFSSPSLSAFCRKLILINNVFITFWILIQGAQGNAFQAWKITNPAGASNLMAAQINMSIPFIIAAIASGTMIRKLLWGGMLCLNMLAVVLVMSRNGIGSMLVLLVLYVMFNQKRLAVCVLTPIVLLAMFPEVITRNPLIRPVLVQLRVLDYKPTAPRSLIWEVAGEHIAEHPLLGVGPGKAQLALAVIDTNHAHNNVVQIALETGLPAAAMYLVLVAGMLYLPGRAIFTDQATFLPTLGILAYHAYSMTAGPIVLPTATLLLGACVNESRMSCQKQERQQRQQRQQQQLQFQQQRIARRKSLAPTQLLPVRT
jgi:O-antigen ligase